MNIEMKDMTNIYQNLGQVLLDEKTYQDIQRDSIEKAFQFHVSNNINYKKYVESFNLENHGGESFSLDKIPLIPSSFFKMQDMDLMSLPKDEIIKFCTSSGTQGNLSIVPRDEDTLLNFYSSIASAMPIYDIERTGNHKVFILGPDTEEAGDLWFSYVLSSMSLSFQTEYLEKNGEFDFQKALKKISDAVENLNEILIIGPPFRILELCEYIKRVNGTLPLCANSYVISAGGWKNRQKEAIPRQKYQEIVKNTFEVDSAAVRDSFNMVELNTVLNECKYHQKHVLPWMDVVARDPKTNKMLPDGEVGILAFYDSSSYSYPCFILGEDYGLTRTGRCKCGWIGKRIEIVRRMNRIESRGCALKMAADKKVDRNSTRYYKSFFRNPSLFKKI